MKEDTRLFLGCQFFVIKNNEVFKRKREREKEIYISIRLNYIIVSNKTIHYSEISLFYIYRSTNLKKLNIKFFTTFNSNETFRLTFRYFYYF